MKSVDVDAGMTVVFSTYQSIDTIAAAQKQGLGRFDLIVCDEAHRTTGVTLAGADESAFVRVHSDGYLGGDRRLYMTATPRIYSDDTRQEAKDRSAAVASMDDNSADFGPEFHRLGFGKAVERGLLTDYKVLILTIDEGVVASALQKGFAGGASELNLDDAAKIIGCWNALAKRSGTFADGTDFGDDTTPMKRAVAFARSIADSKAITENFNAIVDAYDDADEDVLRCDVDHVDGTFNALRRNQLLDWLKQDPGPASARILSNARCLSEGVDVPSLDAVLFLHPRNSVVDVVQSVGRVMRRSEGKSYGYIILPVAVPAGMSPSQALADNQRFKTVWQVLQALRAHDDRFNATVNQIRLNNKAPQNIGIGHVGPGDEAIGDKDGSTVPGKDPKSLQDQEAQAAQEVQLALFTASDWRQVIYARLVDKVGERTYWEDWAKNIAAIAQAHVTRITAALALPEKRAAFEEFVAELRATLNPGVTEADAIDMLAQHIITKPVFDALFGSYAFAEHNPVSLAMQGMLTALGDQGLDTENKDLRGFYDQVRVRAEGIDNHAGRQQVIVELYDKFFKTALPKTADALGIVYTPVEVVDFILRAAEQALARHLGRSLSDEGVHIIDPFVGTGTFPVRLLQSGLIKPEDLTRKYASELHANEIVLLAYYIAAVNIEAAYAELAGDTGGYQPFEGIVLVDTFQLAESGAAQLDGMEVLEGNSERAKRQKAQPIMVVMGNPPYSKGQDSQNDDNQNVKYPALDARIQSTYVARSTATNKNSLYDSYIRAIRWASDRIKDEGIVAFVSNGGYIDGNTADGLRKSLVQEFDAIYCYNLRGNQRTPSWREEGGKIFGAGSQNTVAIMLLVKGAKAPSATGCTLHYRDIGDYLTREDKLRILSAQDLESVPWDEITPNAEGDWVNQRDQRFAEFQPIAGEGGSIFSVNSRGLESGRDAWVYSYSKAQLGEQIESMVDFYNGQVSAFRKHCLASGISKSSASDAEKFIDRDSQKISWTASLISKVAQGVEVTYEADHAVLGNYRPFNHQFVYFGPDLIHRPGKLRQIYPTPRDANFGFYNVGNGSAVPFSVLMLNSIPDLHVTGAGSGGQFFARYIYRELAVDGGFDFGGDDGYERIDNITDAALVAYRAAYDDPSITKDDIFFYTYGLLHSPTYRERFAPDLKKSLPRIPRVRDFRGFAAAGRKLSDLHLGYEAASPYAGIVEDARGATSATSAAELYRVTKMKIPKVKGQPDRSTIIYNTRVTLSNIPEEAYRYQLGARSAIEWIIDRYQVKTDAASGIVNDPNDWSEDPRYIIDLLKRIVTVSLETMKIVDALPALDIIE
jgi:predicted helicase